jgi:hypothetical protein
VSTRNALLVAALTIWLGAGPVVLDQCLVGCHMDVSTAEAPSTPACHEAHQEGGGALWQATTACNHDHSVASAEMAAKAAPESPLKAVTPASGSHDAPAAPAAVNVSPQPSPAGPADAGVLRPLRL